jgi:serine protease SohB
LFKEFVMQGRKNLDMDKIATGEHWYGSKALELNLVDEIVTSDDYLLSKSDTQGIFTISYILRKSFPDRLTSGMNAAYAKWLLG